MGQYDVVVAGTMWWKGGIFIVSGTIRSWGLYRVRHAGGGRDYWRWTICWAAWRMEALSSGGLMTSASLPHERIHDRTSMRLETVR